MFQPLRFTTESTEFSEWLLTGTEDREPEIENAPEGQREPRVRTRFSGANPADGYGAVMRQMPRSVDTSNVLHLFGPELLGVPGEL